jgi:hypothetical protein
MPESLTRRKFATDRQVTGFKTVWWATSNRKPVRLHVGKHGRIKSESAAPGRVCIREDVIWSMFTRSPFFSRQDRSATSVANRPASRKSSI